MRIRIAVPEEHVSPQVIDAALEAVTRLDESMIRAGQTPTSHELIKGGAIWRPENMGDEHFDHGGTIAQRGWGDCDDWAPLHAATLRASGEDPGASARVVPSGPSTYHAIVQRSDGSIDDPSIAAGMRAKRVSGIDGETLQVWACDPHDGRPYQGSLAPTVGPLSIHCGPGIAIRGCCISGIGNLYEARVDVPLDGSPLIGVRCHPPRSQHVNAYKRSVRVREHCRRPVHGVSVVGAIPYALSCTAHGASPAQALNRAIIGAILCGDAAELTTSLDRYKLLAVQAGLAGMSPGQTRDLLIQQIQADLVAQANETGLHPYEHAQALLAQAHAQGIVVGFDLGDIGNAVSSVAQVANAVVNTAKDVVNAAGAVANVVPWGDIIHGVQAAVSVVPGIGTAVSDVIATAETAYESAAAFLHGNPLEAALHAAYNYALSTVPAASALRILLDPVVDALIRITADHEPVESAVLNGILDQLPDQPKIGPISPRSIAASLAHIIVDKLGVKNTQPTAKGAPKPKGPLTPLPMGIVRTPVLTPPKPRRTVLLHMPAIKPKVVVPLHMPVHLTAKPPGIPHAAVHTAALPPPLPASHPAAKAPALKPGSPGAPPGATHWTCTPLPGGQWQCRWT